MKILLTHGYLLTGSGSNVYVQNLCRALTREDHEIHLLCQDARPMDQDFVAAWRSADEEGTLPLSETRETPYPGRCIVYRPEIGDLLPVYVYDEYPGWRVKPFLDLSDDELENYVEKNEAAMRAVLRESGAEALITNHSVPGPLIARRALKGSHVPYLSIVHGSCLQYVARKSERYHRAARAGLEGARCVISPSPHGAGTIMEDFPEMEGKTMSLSGGVDTDLFRPDALDTSFLPDLNGGAGRGPEQDAALADALRNPGSTAEFLESLRAVSRSYDARAHDTDAGERIGRLLESDGPLVVYVGKLIHSKGVHSLLSAFARIHTDTRLLVIGFGTFREGLQAITHALGEGDEKSIERIAELGKLLEGVSPGPLEHFEVTEELLRDASGMHSSVEFVGPLEHSELAKVLPAADVAVVPSIFPEIFGLVAAEFAASGVVPFVADHSGLAEAGAIVGRDLPFDLRVSMDGFEEDLAKALRDYLSLPAEERQRCSRIVRKNSVESLSWDTLARKLVEIASGG